jgi:hypothetical protein
MRTNVPPGVAAVDRDRPDAGDIGRLVLPCVSGDGRCQKREAEQGRSGNDGSQGRTRQTKASGYRSDQCAPRIAICHMISSVE